MDRSAAVVAELLQYQKPRRPLCGAFYTRQEVWAFEVGHLFPRNWVCVGHMSEFGKATNCLVRRIGPISILIVLQPTFDVRAFVNVCMHRGSQLADSDALLSGEGIVCPYHGWRYSLDGELRFARGNGPHGRFVSGRCLQEFSVSVVHGLIFVRLDGGGESSIATFSRHVGPFLRLQGIGEAGLVSKRQYLINANWKLVVENFRECLHCVTAHKSYCNVYEYPMVHEESGLEACVARTEEWGARLGVPAELVGWHSWDETYDRDGQPHFAMRRQIGPGKLSLTEDGRPAGRLMGEFTSYDGGDTVVGLHPFAAVWCANDYAVVFRFVPIEPSQTLLELIWLADRSAIESGDVDQARIEWLWHTTTIEDQKLVERTQQGVTSPYYWPGHFTEQEYSVATTTKWYLDSLDDFV